MVAPWVDSGSECVIVDLKHRPGVETSGLLTRVGGPIPECLELIGLDFDIVFAFPPCTDLASSGARWWAEKAAADKWFQHRAALLALQSAAFAQSCGARWMVENPVGALSRLWRSPDVIVSPHMFTGHCAEDNYTKKTCLWLGGGMNPPEPFQASGMCMPDSRIWREPPGPERAARRSLTPAGFAAAIFKANAK